jgi:hypothetical protein
MPMHEGIILKNLSAIKNAANTKHYSTKALSFELDILPPELLMAALRFQPLNIDPKTKETT